MTRKKLDLTLTSEQRIKNAHQRAIYNLVVKLHTKGRKPEGGVTDDGTWLPSAFEHYDTTKPIKHSARSYTTFPHVYHLIDRAVAGEPVPEDVSTFVKEHWPTLHEKAMVNAVEKNFAAEAEKERLDKKQQLEAEREATAKSVTGRLAARRKQLAGLEKKIKQLESKKNALLTRASRVRRSIGALERSVGK